MVLSSANSYGPAAGTVGTTLGGATVQVGNSTSLGAGDVNVTGSSTLQAGAPGVNLANNIIVANANTVSVAGNGNNLTLSGVISGNGSLTGTGTGTVTLSGANTYAGGTLLNAGVIGVTADGAAAGNPGSLGVVPALPAPNNILLNGGDLLGIATLTLNANRGLGIGSASIANDAVTTGLIDAASGQTLTIAGIIGFGRQYRHEQPHREQRTRQHRHRGVVRRQHLQRHQYYRRRGRAIGESPGVAGQHALV